MAFMVHLLLHKIYVINLLVNTIHRVNYNYVIKSDISKRVSYFTFIVHLLLHKYK